MRESLRWLLESVGLRVETYASAEEFLARFDAAKPGCIVLDVKMPAMDGLDLQNELAKRGVMGAEDRFLNWVPHFHDLGLIAGHLYPMFLGIDQVRMSPFRFLRDPVGWLRAIAEHEAILDALMRRDGGALSALMRDHLGSTWEKVSKIMAEDKAPDRVAEVGK